MNIPAITLWEPWATLIALKEKRFETRGWAVPYRGPIAIHAAKRKSYDQREICLMRDYRAALARHHIAGFDALPFGCVVAIATLTAIYRTEDECYLYTDKERAFGDFAPGRFAWRMEFVHRLDTPLPATGRQKLWRWRVPEKLQSIVRPMPVNKVSTP